MKTSKDISPEDRVHPRCSSPSRRISAQFACPEPGEIIEFRGCVWDDGWEFDAPGVLYSPVCRYSSDIGSLCAEAIEMMVEDVCIDLVVDGEVRRGWSEYDLKEFHWRGWNPDRFRLRKRAKHGIVRVQFLTDGDEMSFIFLETNIL